MEKMIIADLDKLVSLQADKSSANKAKQHRASVAAACRKLVADAAEEGVNVETVAKLYRLAGEASKVPDGTIKAYTKAMRGYSLAIANGVNIEIGGGKDKTKPLAPKWAQDYHTEQTTDPDVLQAMKEEKEVRELIRVRVAALKDLGELQAFADMLPRAEDEVRTEHSAKESKADKEAREKREAYAKALAEELGGAAPAESTESDDDADEVPRTGTDG